MSILFTPIDIGNVTIKNRLMMAPMQQRQGTEEGYATEHHIHHYSERAKHGVGMVIIESTAISKNGRLFNDDIGIYTDEHIRPLKNVVNAIHQHNTPAFIQLCHGGRKSFPETDEKIQAPSSIAFDEYYGTPLEMSIEDIEEVKLQFIDAAKRSVKAGFDGIELHAAHGYLLHQFLSPLSNHREDQYGGNLENRVRLLEEMLDGVRREIGNKYPIQIRFSASDYSEGGLDADQIGKALKILEPLGVDAVHVSSGGLLSIQPPDVYPGYQVPYAETIKKYVSVPVMAVGLIHTIELAEKVINDKQADCIAIGRPLLEYPDFIQKWSEELRAKSTI
jgi:NADPH2 dehydrogenase